MNRSRVVRMGRWRQVVLTLGALVTPLSLTSAQKSTAPPQKAAAKVARTGAQVYTATCVTCHQVDGQGVRGAFPPIVNTDWVNGRAEIPIAIVLHGMTGDVTLAGVKYNVPMAPLGATLSDQEIANVVTYVRAQWGNKGTPVTVADVAAARAATKTRRAPWTAGELRKAFPLTDCNGTGSRPVPLRQLIMRSTHATEQATTRVATRQQRTSLLQRLQLGHGPRRRTAGGGSADARDVFRRHG